ncbi:hypothetical protein AB0E63_44380 [Kribbella sp. NPDC026596]|uniref:hypothetical protein n=1 Tax=Kribbella sp. NPDC026596 TaxID=3155122 RepID=UPI0033CBCFE2
MKHRITAIAVIPFAFTFAFATVGPATASPGDPQPTQQVTPWPDEGSGYPGYADPPAPLAPVEPVNQGTALDTTSIALGALGGIALGGAALGIALGVQRHRDHSAPHPT